MIFFLSFLWKCFAISKKYQFYALNLLTQTKALYKNMQAIFFCLEKKNDVKKCGRLKNGHLMAIVSTDWLMLRCHCVCECECDVGLE